MVAKRYLGNSPYLLHLVLAILALLVGYFFVIQPLNERTQTLDKANQIRQTQLADMQRMAQQLQTNSAQFNTSKNPKILLRGIIASETGTEQQKLLKTRPIDSQRAKHLLLALAPLGKVEIAATADTPNKLVLWFWPN